MDAGVIIAIIVAALIVLALLALIARRGRQRQLDTRRHEAREIRREAAVSSAQADQTRAEADERAARARREEASARERAAAADAQHQEARDRHVEAARRDPDADEREAAEEFDREHSGAGPGAAGAGGAAAGAGGATAAGSRPDEQGITSHGYESGDAEAGDRDRDEAGEEDKPGLKERLFGDGSDDESVEHHERTETPTGERERHLERDESGNVVRDEEYNEPRTQR